MAPSLTRGRVCNLLLLLGSSRAVPLVSESRGTKDHVSLPQILRLPQPGEPDARIYIPQEQGGPVLPPGNGLLRLARYSDPPPHGYISLHHLPEGLRSGPPFSRRKFFERRETLCPSCADPEPAVCALSSFFRPPYLWRGECVGALEVSVFQGGFGHGHTKQGASRAAYKVFSFFFVRGSQVIHTPMFT
jgi:hypothetical protein